MTDQSSAKPSLYRRLRLYLSMMAYGRAHNRDFAREHHAFFVKMTEVLKKHDLVLSNQRVLEVGCGKTMWLTILLGCSGARATGIDTEWTEPGFRLRKYLRILRFNGLERTARTLVWDLIFARPYYRELARQSGFSWDIRRVDGRLMSADDLTFSDSSFDLVVSHEVFEHLPDVEAAARELARVLRPGGLTYIYVHSFTSISGGHHIAWKYPDTEPSTEVPAWDHLRQRRFPDIPSWINGWREFQYREAFERHLEIVDWFPTQQEGRALLSDEIRSELSQYSDDELLNKGFVIIARKARCEARASSGDADDEAALPSRSDDG